MPQTRETHGAMPKQRDYLGVFFISFATLMYEMLLTRIFSVAMWYHFAFVAISAALFGMTIGAIFVYLRREKLRAIGEQKILAAWSIYFALAIVVGLLIFMALPINPMLSIGFFVVAFILLCAITVPFIASGVVLSLALTHYARSVSRVYAIDLLGAALGCFAVIIALQYSDGSTAIFMSALAAFAGALSFAWKNTRQRKHAILGGTCLVVIIAFSLLAISHGVHPYRLIWGKHGLEPRALTEEWNTFSRVSVYPVEGKEPFGWGLSDSCDKLRDVDQLYLNIDGDAGTILTKYNGNPADYQYLGCDITNIVHHLRPSTDTFIIGAGGGRDVLSALTFGDTSVTAVELNGEILRAVNEKFADYTGYLDRIPNVHFWNDEARSFLTRHPKRHDIIQVSLIDTWAATAAGAFALSENALYTREAWSLFFSRLTDHGMLSVSRWYKKEFPAESYRTIALAVAALRDAGVSDPAAHIALVAVLPKLYDTLDEPLGISTVLVSRSPLTEGEITMLQNVSLKYGFTILAAPGVMSEDPILRDVIAGDMEGALLQIPANITAPTDEQPFFFNFIRPIDLVTPDNWHYHNLHSLGLVAAMSVVVLLILAMTLFVPRSIKKEILSKRGKALAAYFVGIGLGFMAIEIGLLERLSIFFGHPSYALLVVLPVLLVGSGLGSMAAEHRLLAGISVRKRLIVLLALLVLVVLLLPALVLHGAAWNTPVRILVAATLLFPLGFMMGMPFAMGMRLAAKSDARLTPWLWGLNGAASVASSILAVLLSLLYGITFALILGIAGYALTLLAAIKLGRKTAE